MAIRVATDPCAGPAGRDTPFDISNDILSRIQKIVENYKGTVIRNPGESLLAIFGLDPANEKHALHACIAAQDICDSGDDSSICMGIHTGEIDLEKKSSATAGIPYRADGEAVYVAEKLAKMSEPGTVLISENVRQLAASRFQTQFHQLYMLANSVSYLRSYTLLKQKTFTDEHASSPFKGRTDELQNLLLGYRLCEEQVPQAFLIQGNPGFGKTRLINEFLRTVSCSRPDVTVIEHSFLPRNSDNLLPCLYSAARKYLYPSRPPLETVQFIESLLGLQDTLAAEGLRCLSGLRSTNEHWHNQDPGTAEGIKASVVGRMLRHLSQTRPLILVLEDIHWANDDLRMFLSQFQRLVSDSKTFLLLSSRHKQCTYPVTRLELGPLRDKDVACLLNDWIGTAETLSSLKQEISFLSEGSPLFIYEIVTDLLDKGYLAGNYGAYRCSAIEKPPTPLTLQVLINSKINSLDNTAYRILKCASIIGMRFDVLMLASLAKMDAGELKGHLAALEARDMIVRLDQDSFQFRHALIYDETYRIIQKPEKKLLHERLFHILRRYSRNRLPAKMEMSAHHAYAAGLYKSAYACNFRLGAQALEKAQGNIALSALACALTCLDHMSETPRNRRRRLLSHFGMIQALSIQGSHDRAKEIIDKIEQNEMIFSDIDLNKKFSCLKLMNAWFAGDLERSLDYGLAFLASLDRHRDSESYIPAAVRVAGILVDMGKYRQAILLLKPLEEFFDLENPPRRYGLLMTGAVSAFSFMARSYGEIEQYEDAEKYAVLALEQAEKNGGYLPIMYALAHGYSFLLRQRKYEKALPFMERAFALLKEAHTDLHYPLIASQLGFIYVNLGQADKGLPLLHKAREVNLKQKSFRHALYIQLLAEAYLLLGDHSNALIYASEAIAIADGHSEQADLARSCLVAAQSQLKIDPASDKIAPFWSKARSLAEQLDLHSLRPEIDHVASLSSFGQA